ncbi:hypothetical protein GCM10025857_24250 [Alicyclobacillus contaminans]|nr:hypothetical protein GCM10025857_24250 [Alicyclobacillus contaminans]
MNQNPALMAVSESTDKFAYVDENNTLHVIDLTTNQDVFTKALNHTAVAITWIGDDSIFVGTEEPAAGGKTLYLSTISVASGQIRLVHAYQGFSSSARFRAITYSPYTNDVYVLIAGNTNSLVYHFDTMSDMSQVSLGGRYVTDEAVTQTTNVLYVQDRANGVPNVLKYSKGTVELVHTNSCLYRVVNDALYFGVLDNQGNVIRIDKDENGQLSVYYTLTAPTSPDKVFVNGDGHILVANGDSLLDEQTHKTIQLPQNSQLSVQANACLAWTKDGTVLVVS